MVAARNDPVAARKRHSKIWLNTEPIAARRNSLAARNETRQSWIFQTGPCGP